MNRKKMTSLMMIISLAVGSCFYNNACAAYNNEEAYYATEVETTETLGVDLAMLDDAEEFQEQEAAAEYLIADFPIVIQMPELPTGCEVTALTMVLNYYGFDIDKVRMAGDYLQKVEANTYYGEDGQKYGPDLNKYFVGDPFSTSGVICGTEAIIAAANSYLVEQGSALRANNLTGTEPEELYALVSQGIPVVVWVTIYMEDRMETQGWYTEDGEYVEWSQNDHGAVLVGYTDTTVTLADPVSGLVEYSKEQFESVYRSRGLMSVILE